jgi:hypothetical protein
MVILCLIGELLLYITTRYIWYLPRHLCYLDLLLFQLITQQSEYLHWILLHEVGFFPVEITITTNYTVYTINQ